MTPLTRPELDRLEAKVAELASSKLVLEFCLSRALQIIKPIDEPTHDFILRLLKEDLPLKGNRPERLRLVGGTDQ